MTGLDKIAVILLAAGRGQRFGADKLRAELGGRPLAHHAAARLATLPFAQRIAVVGAGTPGLEQFGFSQIRLAPPDAPLSRSIALGLDAAVERGAAAVMIVLADMPLVPAAHFTALAAQFDGTRIATRAGETVMPPAIFGAGCFGDLLALQGDRGAGSLLKFAATVELAPGLAMDVDTPEDLSRARQIVERWPFPDQ